METKTTGNTCQTFEYNYSLPINWRGPGINYITEQIRITKHHLPGASFEFLCQRQCDDIFVVAVD